MSTFFHFFFLGNQTERKESEENTPFIFFIVDCGSVVRLRVVHGTLTIIDISSHRALKPRRDQARLKISPARNPSERKPVIVNYRRQLNLYCNLKNLQILHRK